jgi:hypothetical protein
MNLCAAEADPTAIRALGQFFLLKSADLIRAGVPQTVAKTSFFKYFLSN